jgi:hypothetical protein
MSDPPKSPRDIFIEQQIERQIAPFVGVAPPELLATMRAGLEDTLRTYEPAVALIDQLVAHAAPPRTVEGDVGEEGDEALGKNIS